MSCSDAAYPSAVPQHAGCQVILWVPSVLFVFGPFCLPAIRFAFRLSDLPSGHPIKSAGSSFRDRCKNTIFLFKRKATPITEPRGPDLRSILPDIRSTLLDIRFSHPDIRSILPETAPFSLTSAPYFSIFASLALTSAPSSPKPLLPSLKPGRRERNRPKPLLPSLQPGRREQFGRVAVAFRRVVMRFRAGTACVCSMGRPVWTMGWSTLWVFRGNVLMFQSRQ